MILLLRQSRVIKGPENDRITLPKMYDPLADLNQLEASYVFSSRTFKQMPKKRDPQVYTSAIDALSSLKCGIIADYYQFLCPPPRGRRVRGLEFMVCLSASLFTSKAM